MSRTDEIIAYAREIRDFLRTRDPFRIAEYYGIRLSFRNGGAGLFKAQTIRMEKYPTVICINENYTLLSQKILCAHELGHALMHDGVNYFDITQRNVRRDEEYEANLFAVALLFDDTDFNIPIRAMNNATLLFVLEHNIITK